ncbi:hypothetical protein [Nonlabens xiamenensis]|uniref:hypothetical protein n=1 Tax=Nonlabens xiamenensis TaxID=2341043 RepID=UPI000F60E584|nr:hypothetical protein [Nonlabens xiamenensis]
MGIEEIIGVIIVTALVISALANFSFVVTNKLVLLKQENRAYYKRGPVIRLFNTVFLLTALMNFSLAFYLFRYVHLRLIIHTLPLAMVCAFCAAITVVTAIAYFRFRTIFTRAQIPVDIHKKKLANAKEEKEKELKIRFRESIILNISNHTNKQELLNSLKLADGWE